MQQERLCRVERRPRTFNEVYDVEAYTDVAQRVGGLRRALQAKRMRTSRRARLERIQELRIAGEEGEEE